jgi:hypothetical protein
MTEPIKPSSIDEFVSSFKSDGYHLNSRFACEFSIIPPVFQKAISNNFGSNRDFASTVAKRVQRVVAPTISLSTADVRSTAVTFQVPYQRNYEGSLTLTFISDKEQKLRNTFVNWIEGINNPYIGSYEYRDNYVARLEINQVDHSDNIIRSYSVLEVFPRNIAGIDYNATSNELTQFTVDLTFKEFFVNDAFGSDELFPPLQGGFPGPIDVGPEGVDPNQGDFPNVGDIFA